MKMRSAPHLFGDTGNQIATGVLGFNGLVVHEHVLQDLAAEVTGEGDGLQRLALFQERVSLGDKRVDDVPAGRRNGCGKCVLFCLSCLKGSYASG